jgi:hypothetical protein
MKEKLWTSSINSDFFLILTFQVISQFFKKAPYSDDGLWRDVKMSI